MIESLLLKNFQIHKYLEIEFDQITVITGDNDRGKTAVLRALRWLILNKPSGEEFRKWGSKKTLVRLKVDGHIIRRLRSSKNSYRLDEQKPLFSFGTGVPSSITKLLNVQPENFQMQHDPLFWMTESPSQVARNLNKIVNLEIIDEALTNIAHENRRAKLLVEVSRDRLNNARAKKKDLSWVPAFCQGVESLEEQQNQINALKQKQGQIKALIETVQNHQHLITIAGQPLKLGRQLVDRGATIQEKKIRLRELNTLIEEYETWQRKVKEKESQIADLTKELKKIKNCPVCGAVLAPSSALISISV